MEDDGLMIHSIKGYGACIRNVISDILTEGKIRYNFRAKRYQLLLTHSRHRSEGRNANRNNYETTTTVRRSLPATRIIIVYGLRSTTFSPWPRP